MVSGTLKTISLWILFLFMVIRENEPSYIYFDLEYNKELNPVKDGNKMTSVLIEVVLAYILKYWPDKTFTEKNVVNLTSTTDTKFSKHLIFNTREIAFKNNYHVGKFVKKIYNDILDHVIDNKPNDILKLFKKNSLEELIVLTEKGRKLFIDTAVYTKNRHFRIFKSTKWGKLSYLTIDPYCKYVPRANNTNKNLELQFFLDSLISFFPNKNYLSLLEFDENNDPKIIETVSENTQVRKRSRSEINSQYPELDRHIREIVQPGRIRCCKYNEDMNRIVYEIVGNRYCRNIGRSHKSNNIYWVVDLTTKCRFQKCHDEDCLGFVSEPEQLPDKVCFQFDDDLDLCLSNLPVTVLSAGEIEGTV